jgi:glucose-6-phosphate isomerase
MSMKYAASSGSAAWVLKCTDLPQFDALAAAADLFRTDDKLHLRILCNDSIRCSGLISVQKTKSQRKLILDYSRQCVTGETMELLFDLADAVGLTDRREAMRSGERINLTEGMPVLHHALRMPANFDFVITNQLGNGNNRNQNTLHGPTILAEIHETRKSIETFSEQVRSGSYRSVTDEPFLNVLVIGLGGYHLGTEWVAEALRSDPVAAQAAEGRTLQFLGNLDPIDFHLRTKNWKPSETLVIVISESFMTVETAMINARTAKNWLIQKLANESRTEEEVLAKHMVAITAAPERCQKFGIVESNVYALEEWISARHAVCSVVGLLPLCLQYSYPVLCEFLDGAHNMDEHFFHAPLRDNIPVILGLLGVWNSTFLGFSCRAILPYCQALHRFPAYVQHLDMESNGKRVALDGTPLLHRSAEISFGEPGTIAQTSFFQVMHQGRVVPSDFIGFMESQQPEYVPGEAVSNHDELMSHFFSEPDTLACGKTLVDLAQEGAPEPLREHMVCPGNRPSSSILMSKLDAYAVGQLMALYEHRTAVQGFVWGLNSFDNFAADSGVQNMRHIRAQLSASRKTGASVQGFNTATSALLDHYLRYGK